MSKQPGPLGFGKGMQGWFKNLYTGTFLVVHWLRICTSTAGAQVWSLVRALRPGMPLKAWPINKKTDETYETSTYNS